MAAGTLDKSARCSQGQTAQLFVKDLRKLRYILLVGSIGLIGADRIDFFAAKGPFTLTPFLVMAPLVLLISLFLSGPQGLFRLTILSSMRRQLPFLYAVGLFLFLTFGSILFSLDPSRSLVAFTDLVLVSFLGYCISVQILADPEQDKLIKRSVTFALVMYLLFCVAEIIAFSQGLTLNSQRSGSWVQSTFAPSSFWRVVPILPGTTFDANRSGFILMMYSALLDRFASKWRYTPLFRILITILILLTFSRSGTLCWLAYHLCSRSFWKKVLSRRALVSAAAVAIIAFAVGFAYQNELSELVNAWQLSNAVSAKLSMDPGSSGESHILLIERGLKTWLTSPKTIVAGIGFAAAPQVLQDFFQDDKHGNFHSLYVTALAEMGLPAFLILMFILVYPLFGRRGAIPCVAAIMIFNVSYQTHMEPVFWLMLAMVWSFEREYLGLRSAFESNDRGGTTISAGLISKRREKLLSSREEF
ncbi:MAG TPA: O-antigen ligase family protein [Candidatus Sulfotelmatobacter sp.]|nr:O-antigen ligase family protein [Candidatus Sulfotelmatobacter sp.]